jgi:hypothetical protein
MGTTFTKRVDADIDLSFSGSYSKALRFTSQRSTGDGEPRRRRGRVPAWGFGVAMGKMECLGDKDIMILREDDGVVKQMVK